MEELVLPAGLASPKLCAINESSKGPTDEPPIAPRSSYELVLTAGLTGPKLCAYNEYCDETAEPKSHSRDSSAARTSSRSLLS